jgi:hypothetical protein
MSSCKVELDFSDGLRIVARSASPVTPAMRYRTDELDSSRGEPALSQVHSLVITGSGKSLSSLRAHGSRAAAAPELERATGLPRDRLRRRRGRLSLRVSGRVVMGGKVDL